MKGLWSPPMRLIGAIACLLMPVPLSASGEADNGTLENGTQISIEEASFQRGVPHFHYDQAMASISALYPDSEILLARRSGRLGGAVYSLIAYRQNQASKAVVVSGMAAVDGRAWRFSGRAPLEQFANSLVLLLERVSELPPKS